MDPRTLVWEFEPASNRAVLAWLADDARVELGSVQNRTDVYFDTADLRLLRAGRQLRTTRAQEADVAFFEPLDGANGTCEPTSAPVAGVFQPTGFIAREARSVVGGRPLVRLLSIKVQTRSARIRCERVPVDLEWTRLVVVRQDGQADAPRWRLAVRAPRTTASLSELMARLEATDAVRPAEPILATLGLEPDSVPPLPSLADETTLGGLALAVCAVQRRGLWEAEPVARLGDDPEGVHDLRVALRRLRVALAVFAPSLGDVEPMRTEAKWITDLLSHVRDLDVLLPQLDLWPLEPDDRAAMKKAAFRRRRTCRRTMRDALDSPRYQKFLAALDGLRAEGPAADTPAAGAAADLVDRARRSSETAAKRAEGGEPERLHRLRIRLKRLRYTTEFFRHLAPDEAGAFAKRLAHLQDLLGEHQDLQVQAEWLSRLGPMMPEATLAGLESVRRSREKALRKEAAKAAKDCFGKPYRELERALVRLCVKAWR